MDLRLSITKPFLKTLRISSPARKKAAGYNNTGYAATKTQGTHVWLQIQKSVTGMPFQVLYVYLGVSALTFVAYAGWGWLVE